MYMFMGWDGMGLCAIISTKSRLVITRGRPPAEADAVTTNQHPLSRQSQGNKNSHKPFNNIIRSALIWIYLLTSARTRFTKLSRDRNNEHPFSHHQQGMIDFNTVKCQSFPVLREGFSDPLPVEKLMMRECSYSTKTREVLGNPSPPPSRFPLAMGFAPLDPRVSQHYCQLTSLHLYLLICCCQQAFLPRFSLGWRDCHIRC